MNEFMKGLMHIIGIACTFGLFYNLTQIGQTEIFWALWFLWVFIVSRWGLLWVHERKTKKDDNTK